MERTRIPDREASITLAEEDDVFSMAEDVWESEGFEHEETEVSSIEVLGDPVIVVRYILGSNDDTRGEYFVVIDGEDIRRRMLEFTRSDAFGEIELYLVNSDGLNQVV